ncbi:MAG: hypothetical protein K2X57_20790 [Xanthobacteraceae bacterium]|nr:hypothetical protein [Xanthobacteraceae bacterium]
MTSGMTALLVAVGGTSLIGYLLMNRGQSRAARRGNTSGGDSDGSASYDSSGNGWNIFSWFSADSSSSDDSASSGASGDWGSSAGDSSGGGDSGGGGDGG